MPPTVSLQARPYYPELDGVRALATAMILLFHLALIGVRIPGPVILGQTGVDLFFVLSGFLITSILLKARERDWREVRTFYARRSLRIFPLYFGYLSVAALFGTSFSPWSWVYLQNVAFALHQPMGSIGHFWSLAVEEQFYLVWPFLVLFLPRRRLQPALWLMMATSIVARAILLPMRVDVFYPTITRLDGLAAGSLLALFLYQGKLHAYRKALGILGVAASMVLAWEVLHLGGHQSFLVETTRYTLIAFVYAAAVGLLIAGGQNPVAKMLSASPLRFLGRVSYGVYVFHPQALAFAFSHLRGRPAGVRVAAGLGLTGTLTLLSWYGWERPFLRLKDRFPQPSDAPKSERPLEERVGVRR